MTLRECDGCDVASTCTAPKLFDTIWGDSGERVEDKDVAVALSGSGVARAEDCAALTNVDEFQKGVIAKVQVFMDEDEIGA